MAIIRAVTSENNYKKDQGKFCILITGTVDGNGYHPFNDIDDVKQMTCKLYREDGFYCCFDTLDNVEVT